MKDLKKKYLILLKSKLIINIFHKWPVLLIAGLVILFFWKAFFLQEVALPADFIVGTYYPWLDYKWGYPVGVPVKNPITTDVVSFTYPVRILTVEMFKKGILPLWNPYILSGTPLLANLQSAPFTLTNIFYFLTDELTAWNLQVASQHFFAAFFMFILLRSWRISKISSVFGGLLFAFSGFNLIWSQWNERSLTAAIIPLLIFIQEKFLLKGKWLYGFGFSLTICFQIATGYPQIVLYTYLTLLIHWFFILKRDKGFFYRSAVLAFFLLVGIGLSSVQLIPFQELLVFSQRLTEPIEAKEVFFPLEKIITFIAPDYYGNPSTGNYWGTQDYTSITGYVGIIAIVLATLALKRSKEKRVINFVKVLVISSLILSFATPVSENIWKSQIFGLQAAMAHRALVLFTFSVSVLAAFGMDQVIYVGKSFYIIFFLPLILFLFFGLYSLLSYIRPKLLLDIGFIPQTHNHSFVALKNFIFPLFIFVLAFSALFFYKKRVIAKKFLIFAFFSLMLIETFRFGWKYTPFSSRDIVYPKTPVIDYLISQEKPFRVTTTDVIPINIKMTYGLESLEGYGAVYPLGIAEFIAYLNSGEVNVTPQGRYGTVSNLNSHLLELTNTKYLLALKNDQYGQPNQAGELSDQYVNNKKLKKVFEDKTTVVLENTSSLPRAFMVYDWEVEKNTQKVAEKLLNRNYPFSTKIILSEDVPLSLPKKNVFENSVTYKKYTDQESLISVKTNSYGFLFISDSYYPGWTAFVDGEETKIHKADYTFRAVYIPEGEHIVRLVYKPESFHRGVIYTFASFMLLMISYPVLRIFGKRIGVSYTSTDKRT